MPLVATALFVTTLLEVPSASGLQWEAPEGCPGSAEVQRAFDRHAKQGGQPVDAVGRVTTTSAGYLLTLELRTATSEDTRVIEAPSCDALAETAGLLIAVASEPKESFVPEPSPEPSPDSSPEPRANPESPEEPTPPTTPRSEPLSSNPGAGEAAAPSSEAEPVRFALGLEGQVQALRLLPQIVGGGVTATAGVLGAGWRAELRAASEAGEDGLQEEVALIGAVKSALDRGRPADAIRRLDEHARLFSTGELSLERRGYRAIALCELGKDIQGRGAGRTFVKAHPNATLAGRVREACSLQTNSSPG